MVQRNVGGFSGFGAGGAQFYFCFFFHAVN